MNLSWCPIPCTALAQPPSPLTRSAKPPPIVFLVCSLQPCPNTQPFHTVEKCLYNSILERLFVFSPAQPQSTIQITPIGPPWGSLLSCPLHPTPSSLKVQIPGMSLASMHFSHVIYSARMFFLPHSPGLLLVCLAAIILSITSCRQLFICAYLIEGFLLSSTLYWNLVHLLPWGQVSLCCWQASWLIHLSLSSTWHRIGIQLMYVEQLNEIKGEWELPGECIEKWGA